jgi:hypothetical protein
LYQVGEFFCEIIGEKPLKIGEVYSENLITRGNEKVLLKNLSSIIDNKIVNNRTQLITPISWRYILKPSIQETSSGYFSKNALKFIIV